MCMLWLTAMEHSQFPIVQSKLHWWCYISELVQCKWDKSWVSHSRICYHVKIFKLMRWATRRCWSRSSCRSLRECSKIQAFRSKVLCTINRDYRFLYFSAGPEIGIFLEPLNLPSQELVFFVVNDNDSKHSAGGSHWYIT